MVIKLQLVQIQLLIDNRISWLGSWLCSIARHDSQYVKAELANYAIKEVSEIIALEALLES